MVFKKTVEETDQQFIYRVCKSKDVDDLTWQDIADICNSELDDYDFSESWYRKRWNGFKELSEAKENIELSGTEVLADIEYSRREYEKEKIRFRDERNEYNRLLRQEARYEADLDTIKNIILEQKPIKCDIPKRTSIVSDNDMLVLLTDMHIGQCFDSYWGKYNSDIAKLRLAKYISHIVSTQKLYGSQDCYVALLGDLVSGGLHPTIKVSDRENTIQQVMMCSEIVLWFVSELAKEFNKVTIAHVDGNHSRIDKKELALKDERLDQIIPWYVKTNTEKAESIVVTDSIYDNTLSRLNIRGKSYILCHGDYDGYNKTGAMKIASMIGEIPYAILFGHFHTNAFSDDADGIKLIRGGSLSGSGCDYTIQKRLNGNAGQMCCVVNNSGVHAVMPVDLEIY